MTDAGLVHIVDDDSAVRTALSSLMRSVGYEALHYGSAAEFDQASFPLCRRACCSMYECPAPTVLRSTGVIAKSWLFFPVVLMTGYGDVQMSVRGLKAGALDFLTKPLRHQDVRAMLLRRRSTVIASGGPRRPRSIRFGCARNPSRRGSGR